MIGTVSPATDRLAVRADDEVFAATVNVTVPFPFPLAPFVIASQVLPSVAVQEHPLPAVTATLSVPPDAAAGWVGDETLYEHGVENEKVLERALLEVPPGPTAATADSYAMPAVGSAPRRETKFTRILPSGSPAGFPSDTVWNGSAAPTMKNSKS